MPFEFQQSTDETTPASLCADGFAHLRAGRLIDAQVCCQNALALDALYPDALSLMGLLALETGQADHAVDWLARAIARDPKAGYLLALGIALQRLGRLEEAARAFETSAQLKPQDPNGWRHLAGVLLELERPELALSAFRTLLTLNPGDWEAAFQCGVILLKEGQLDEALAVLRQYEAARPGEASHNPNLCNNVGVALQSARREQEAIAWFDKALCSQPDFVMALRNKALGLVQLGRFDEAIATFDRATTIAPGNAEIAWNVSLLHLMKGDFESGWTGREARWQSPMRSPSYPQFPQPMWLGDVDVAGKTILVAEDEGLGDTIQFCRYIPLLAARGARVILLVRDQLYPLLSGLNGLVQCIPTSERRLPEFDLHCPICSLPKAFETRLETIPATVPYLPAPAASRVQAWEDRLRQRMDKSLRVGLVWSGNPQHGNDRNRSIPLQSLSRILDTDSVFVSLQKELHAGDAALLEQSSIVEVASHLTDFTETAALVSCLDLIVTVDTSVAHLAGALGRPTWLLLPFVPDYRWLLGRDDSPWYPSMRLFRQDEDRDWTNVLDRVRSELIALTSARR